MLVDRVGFQRVKSVLTGWYRTMTTETQTTKEQILTAACHLMSVKGYNHTSLDDVLSESGVGKGNFYYYFKSKEELGYAILDRITQQFVARVIEPAFHNGSLTPLERIHRFLDGVLESQRKRNCVGGCPIGNLASELSDLHEGFRRRLAQIFTLWRENLGAALRQGQAEGSFRSDLNPEAMTHFLVAGLEGAILMAKVTKEIRVMETCVSELKAHLNLYATE
jgi:TetR/AcrR family transcriptional repressor of nem operon